MPSTYTPSNTNHASITLPSDGDDASAASIDTPLEAIADNAQYAFSRLNGVYRVVAVSAPVNPGPAGWGALGAYVTTIGAFPGPLLIFGSIVTLPGDIITIQGSVSLTVASGAGQPSAIRLEYKENYTGSGSTTGDATSEQKFDGALVGTFPGVALFSSHQVVTGGMLAVFFNAHETGAGAPAGSLAITQGTFIYAVYRPN